MSQQARTLGSRLGGGEREGREETRWSASNNNNSLIVAVDGYYY